LIYVVVVASAELYDRSAGTFTATGSMTIARVNHTATLLSNGKVLIVGGTVPIGGASIGVTASAELYDPNTGTFALTGSMAAARNNQSATLIESGARLGQVLIAGGDTLPTALSSAELFNPATGKFSSNGTMTAARTGQTATLLADGPLAGHVLLAGGRGNSGILSSTELYDPGSGTFTATDSMTTARVGDTATLISSGPLDGQVLIAGGETPSGSISASAGLYDQSTALVHSYHQHGGGASGADRVLSDHRTT
jgi:hypothetical protein